MQWFNTTVDVIEFLGSLASLIGIPLAVYQVLQARDAARRSAEEAEQSKNASVQAYQLVEKTRQDLKLLGNVLSFERAVRLMDEIKTLIRNITFTPVPEKISVLITLLNEVRGSSEMLTPEDRSLIQEAVVEFRKIENSFDGSALNEKSRRNVAKFTKIISTQIDQIQPVLVVLRDKIGK